MRMNEPYILCFGRDKVLLETRQRLLEYAGYSVVATMEKHTAEACLVHGGVAVLILCHTITAMDMEAVSKVHHDLRSPAVMLCLSGGGRKPQPECSHVYDVHKGPAAFLSTVKKLESSSAVMA